MIGYEKEPKDMTDEEFEEWIKEEDSKVAKLLKDTFPAMTQKEGKAIWTLFVNRLVVLPSGRKVYGTMRWWAGIIASVCDHNPSERHPDDYRRFYFSYSRDRKFVTETREKLEEAGWRLQ